MGITTNADDYELFDAAMNSDKNIILIYAMHKFGVYKEDINFIPNNEVSAIKIVNTHVELAFPHHTINLARALGLDNSQ